MVQCLLTCTEPRVQSLTPLINKLNKHTNEHCIEHLAVNGVFSSSTTALTCEPEYLTWFPQWLSMMLPSASSCHREFILNSCSVFVCDLYIPPLLTSSIFWEAGTEVGNPVGAGGGCKRIFQALAIRNAEKSGTSPGNRQISINILNYVLYD